MKERQLVVVLIGDFAEVLVTICVNCSASIGMTLLRG